jgi:hypothetical protein
MTDRDPLLVEMDDDTLIITGRMSAQCIEQGLEMTPEGVGYLLRELCDRLEARDA